MELLTKNQQKQLSTHDESVHLHSFTTKSSTCTDPYQYEDFGLTNVFLTGISISQCMECGEEQVEIPAMGPLLDIIAKSIVQKPTQLQGNEIKFLRKFLGLKSAVFAQALGVTPEEISRWENNRVRPSPLADRLIRLFFFTSQNTVNNSIPVPIADWLISLTKKGCPTPILLEWKMNLWIHHK